MAETTELEYLKQELEENQNIVSFALFYDRENKKFLAIHNGDEAIIEKMLKKAVTTNGFFASMIRKVADLFNSKIPNQNPFGKIDPLSRDMFDFLHGK